MTPLSPRTSGPSRGGRAGFTLIEILLALAIFAGVIAAIYSSWTAILRSARLGQTVAAEAQRNRIAVAALTDALVSAQMFSANARYYSFLADTSEETASLSFVAHLPESFPRSGHFGALAVRRVTFLVERDQGGVPCLTLRQTPVLFEPDRNEEENPLVLARHVAQFVLEFWGQNSREWEVEWLRTNELPRFVRFQLALRSPTQPAGRPTRVIARVVTLPVTATPATVPGLTRPGGQLPGGTNRPGGIPGPRSR